MPLPSSTSSFQFHSGSIKSLVLLVIVAAVAVFQFHSGSIKREDIVVLDELKKRFNSIVVRLKEPSRQFPILAVQCFNSIVVRLKGDGEDGQ